MKYLIFLGILTIGYTISSLPENSSFKTVEISQQLSDEFVNPPSSYRPGAFWCWLNGNMSTTSITRDLEAMKSKGMNRAEIWDVAAIRNPSFIPAGAEFLGVESVSLIKIRIETSKHLQNKSSSVKIFSTNPFIIRFIKLNIADNWRI